MTSDREQRLLALLRQVREVLDDFGAERIWYERLLPTTWYVETDELLGRKPDPDVLKRIREENMKCPAQCAACDEYVELHTMRSCPRCGLLVCDECRLDDRCIGCDGVENPDWD
jgi:hypothetical protein